MQSSGSKREKIKSNIKIPELVGLETHEKHHITYKSVTTCKFTLNLYLLLANYESLNTKFIKNSLIKKMY